MLRALAQEQKRIDRWTSEATVLLGLLRRKLEEEGTSENDTIYRRTVALIDATDYKDGLWILSDRYPTDTGAGR